MTTTALLHERIAAVCPIDGVSIGTPSVKETWKIHFKDDATPEQQAAAAEIVENFDFNAATISSDNVEAAKIALQKSDIVLIRSMETGSKFPKDWVKYRNDLRTLIQAGSGLLPDMPEYPET